MGPGMPSCSGRGAQEAQAGQPKRPPGRPPKNAAAALAVAGKEEAAAAAAALRKVAAGVAAPLMRRGRPPKNPQPALGQAAAAQQQNLSAAAAAGSAAPPKQRGRPPKHPQPALGQAAAAAAAQQQGLPTAAAGAVAPPKRRGRPPKNPHPASGPAAAGAQQQGLWEGKGGAGNVGQQQQQQQQQQKKHKHAAAGKQGGGAGRGQQLATSNWEVEEEEGQGEGEGEEEEEEEEGGSQETEDAGGAGAAQEPGEQQQAVRKRKAAPAAGAGGGAGGGKRGKKGEGGAVKRSYADLVAGSLEDGALKALFRSLPRCDPLLLVWCVVCSHRTGARQPWRRGVRGLRACACASRRAGLCTCASVGEASGACAGGGDLMWEVWGVSGSSAFLHACRKRPAECEELLTRVHRPAHPQWLLLLRCVLKGLQPAAWVQQEGSLNWGQVQACDTPCTNRDCCCSGALKRGCNQLPGCSRRAHPTGRRCKPVTAPLALLFAGAASAWCFTAWAPRKTCCRSLHAPRSCAGVAGGGGSVSVHMMHRMLTAQRDAGAWPWVGVGMAGTEELHAVCQLVLGGKG